jgi:hypothetical protein
LYGLPENGEDGCFVHVKLVRNSEFLTARCVKSSALEIAFVASLDFLLHEYNGSENKHELAPGFSIKALKEFLNDQTPSVLHIIAFSCLMDIT